MTAPGFSRDSIPSMPESEHLASDEHWRDARNRYVNGLLVGAFAVALLVLPAAIWLLNGRRFV